ncbi:aminotransferase class V-fold PLP-dependent enzyme [Kitasatospora purpeofusca]|uniref:pyridoxal phosphate-dependent decarboxylase family protein n=1 Tax=Kitasatospora purpeofusca TaxID=67352 RepID=UPI002E0D61E3|nr:aminotransferase class V-fold PLP-dependent enzyme [Kitasatospora purpeofusca]
MDLSRWLLRAVDEHEAWTEQFGEPVRHSATAVDERQLEDAFQRLGKALATCYPFFHPRYAGQMIKPPHPVAVVGQLAAMLVNPNNHALDGGPATTALEEEAVGLLAGMVGFATPLGHLTGGGTMANLEALFVARESHPHLGVAASAEAHYTHTRMCHLLGMQIHQVPADEHGRMDQAALRELLATGRVGTVVATAGTTGTGAVDPIHTIVDLARDAGARVHVDAAYGGFFRLLADEPDRPLGDPDPWRAISRCDSVVVDPHKHGLQPYGCGAVLFADPEVARFYRHDSPYTYYTSGRPHLGEISLECSRPGAAAAALWLTLQVFPLTASGLGSVLAPGRRAAVRWSALLEDSPELELFQQPDLDIVTYFPATPLRTMGAVDRAAQALSDRCSVSSDPLYVSVSRASAQAFTKRPLGVAADLPEARILRSVLMKPEAEIYLGQMHSRLEEEARALRA